MKKKVLLSTLLIVGLLATATPVAAAPPSVNTVGTPVTIHVDGEYLPTDVDPVLEKGRTLVPLRAAGEAVGAEVLWDQPTQTATVTKDGTTVSFKLGSITYFVNGESRLTDVPPQMKNNRTMLPIRALAEAIGTDVTWNQDLLDVAITTNGQIISIPHASIVDPQAYDAINFVRKYYVAPDPSDPFIGTWRESGTTTGMYGNPAPSTHYSFVSKLKDGTYSCVIMNVTLDSGFGPTPIIMIHKESGQTMYDPEINQTILRTSNDMIITYFRGPAMGFSSSGYVDYYIDSHNNLVNYRSINTFGGQYLVNYPYIVAEPFIE